MKRIIKEILKFSIGGFFLLLFFSVRWGLKNWDTLTLEEVLFQLHHLEGTGGGMMGRYFREAAVPALIVFVILFLAYLFLHKKGKNGFRFSTIVFLAYLIAGLAAFVYFGLRIGVLDYYMGSASKSLSDELDGQEFIEYYYVDPKDVTLHFPDQKKNLIFIYLESFEMTFADTSVGGDFPINVIPEMTEIGLENLDFSEDGKLNGAISYNGTNWTMGAIFGMTSGLPLKVNADLENAMNYYGGSFPELVCLGDILKDEGYVNEFMCGTDGEFGGRAYYLRNHGDYEVWDFLTAKEKGKFPEDYYVWWGYEDEKLFSYAQEELARLAKGDAPFHLSLLTVDTHFENGYICDDCVKNFVYYDGIETDEDQQYANVYHCSSRRVAKFIRWIQKQDFYEDTTIVICGDHPTMDSNFCDGVSKDYLRKTYTVFIHPSKDVPETYREYSTLDLFPTTLSAMGVSIEGDRLGLGTDLFSGTATLTEKYGYELNEAALSERSKFVEKLSGMEE